MSILGFDYEIYEEKKNDQMIKVNYNQKVYFEPVNKNQNNNDKQFKKILSNVYNNKNNHTFYDTKSKIKDKSNNMDNFVNSNSINLGGLNNDFNINYFNKKKNDNSKTEKLKFGIKLLTI